MAATMDSRTGNVNFLRHERAAKNHVPGIAFVIFLHILIVWALVSGLARKAVELVAKPLETKLIAEVTKPPENLPPPPPPPKMAAPPPPFIPPPEINVQVAATPSPTAISAVTTTAPPPGPAPVAVAETKAPVRTAPVVQAKSCQPPEYPSASRRLNEQGTVVLNFLIDAEGKVIESRVDSSSGIERLDEAARKALSLCRFSPGTVDGKPEQSWHKLKYVWKLDR
jgi:periplasmic protein TonB